MKAQTKAELKAEIARLRQALNKIDAAHFEMERTHKAEVEFVNASPRPAGLRYYYGEKITDSFWYWLGFADLELKTVKE